MIPHYPTLGDAILYLEPKAKFIIRDENIETLEWVDYSILQPSNNDVLSTLEMLKTESTSSEYKIKRASEYPSIGDQLDSLFHAGVFPPEMAQKIQETKNKYPKVIE
jgi:hypothetical protein